MEKSNTTSIVIGIVVVAIIVIVGWLAYSQGYFTGGNQNAQQDQGTQGGIQVNVGGDTGGTQPTTPAPSGNGY